jgi:opacity protein-like surface antigen
MKSKSITHIFCLLLVTTVFLIMPGVGRAALWVGGQAGAHFVADGDVKITSTERLKNVKSDTAFIGGIIIGYDFVKEGFLGYDWPKWMKYFSVALNVLYNNFNQPAQDVQAQGLFGRRGQFPIHINAATGYILELSMLFMAKYGLFPTAELPFGRLIPYVGVGPAGIFSVVDTDRGTGDLYPSSDSAELGLVTEAGVRYMLRRHVSLDAAFRYRYVFPSYDRNYFTNLGHFVGIGRIIVQSFNVIFRVNYHF